MQSLRRNRVGHPLGCALMNSVTGAEYRPRSVSRSNPALQDSPAAGSISLRHRHDCQAADRRWNGQGNPVLNNSRSSRAADVPTAMEQVTTLGVHLECRSSCQRARGGDRWQAHQAMLETMKTQPFGKKLDAVGLKLVPKTGATPGYLDRFVQSEIAKWPL